MRVTGKLFAAAALGVVVWLCVPLPTPTPTPVQVMNLVLLCAKRAGGCPPDGLRVGKPHGAESGFDPHSAYADVNDDNFFQYINGEILGPEEPSEWVRGVAAGSARGSLCAWFGQLCCCCKRGEGKGLRARDPVVCVCHSPVSCTGALWRRLGRTRRPGWGR
jgi:hypothetical protein